MPWPHSRIPSFRHEQTGRPYGEAAEIWIEPSPDGIVPSASVGTPASMAGIMPAWKRRSSRIWLKSFPRGPSAFSSSLRERSYDLEWFGSVSCLLASFSPAKSLSWLLDSHSLVSGPSPALSP